MAWFRTAVFAVVGLVVLALGLALGLVALGLALVLAPVVFLVARWMLRRSGVHVVHVQRSRMHKQGHGREVYEGEYRVLDERRER
ncbi:MAG TPA: hypothetical protein VFV74_09965 [Burkholderiales bacterium]|nr:hypothetical protein [Burkholderiales bacterium]